MRESRFRGGVRLLLELGVVFLGVVIALGADSWAQDRADQARIESHLRALDADLAASRASIQFWLDRTIAQRVAADTSTLRLLSDEPIDGATIGLVGWGDHPALSLGTFNTLLATGDINLLGDSVRVAIVGAFTALEPETVTLDLLYQLGSQLTRDHIFVMAELHETRGSFDEIPLARARRDPRILATYYLYRGALGNRRNALTAMLGIVTELEARLAARGR